MLAQFYPPVIGGEERHVRNLSRELAAQGHDVHVATMTGAGGDAEPIADQGVTIHRVRGTGEHVSALYRVADRPLALPIPDPITTWDISRVVHEVDPDVVHAHNWIVHSYIALPDSARRPLVLTLHDYGSVCATKRLMREGAPCPGPNPGDCLPCAGSHYGRMKGPAVVGAVSAMAPLLRSRIDQWLAVSRAVLDRTVGAETPNARVIPNFVPDELGQAARRPRHPELPDGDYLLFVGDLSAEKGLLTLLSAYDRLPVGRPELVLVGRPTPDLPHMLPEGAHVHRGWDHDRIVNAFQHALAAVLPSEWHDPCPTTVLEAMSLGTPLVTTLMGGIADMVQHELSALVVTPGSVDDLASALALVAADGQLREDLAAMAKVAVLPFTASRVSLAVAGVYRQVQEGHTQ